MREPLKSSQQLPVALTGAGRAAAREVVANAFDNAVPDVHSLPTGYDLLRTLQGRWRAALNEAERLAAGEVRSALVPDLAALRREEIRTSPFAGSLYRDALQALRSYDALLKTDDQKLAALEAEISPSLKDASRRFTRRSRRAVWHVGPFEWWRLRRLSKLRTELMELVRVLRQRLDATCQRHIEGCIAAALREEIARRQSALEAAVVRLRELADAGGPDRERLQRALDETAVSRRRTRAEHAYSRPPEADVVLRFAAHRRPEVLDPAAEPRSGVFWAVFGSWLESRASAWPETVGAAGIEDSVAAFVADLTAGVFPGDLSLATLYRTVGAQLPVIDLRGRSAPRTRVAREEPPFLLTVIEAPEELEQAEEWNALAGERHVRRGPYPQVIRVATFGHGYTLMEILRSENQPIPQLQQDLASRASTPLFEQAIRSGLPGVAGASPRLGVVEGRRASSPVPAAE